MNGATLVPEAFGALQGVRILSTGSVIAQPYAAALAAQWGAEVIQVENPHVPDLWRTVGLSLPAASGGTVSTSFLAERRNEFNIRLDLSTAEGKDLFLRLVERADVWMESSKPGTYAKWGLSDDVILARNPRLVITHVSGYGQDGEPSYLGRASYDMIGQAFGGTMHQTGFPDSPPTRAAPWIADYITALYALSSTVAALVHAKATGQGQVIDLAQFEAIHAILGGTMIEYFHLGVVRERSGNKSPAFQPYDVYQCANGNVVIASPAPTIHEKVCKLLGLDHTDPYWETARTAVNDVNGLEFDALLRGWCEGQAMEDVIAILNEHGIPCAPILDAKGAADDPHYRARNVHVEWDDYQAGRLRGTGVVPRFSATPGKIWRGTGAPGADNDAVLGGVLGLSEAEVGGLRDRGIV